MPMEQVKECICQEQQIKTLSDRLGTSSGAYSQRQKELQDTEQQLADLQRTAQPREDPDAVYEGRGTGYDRPSPARSAPRRIPW
jgi:hypothetical protein